MISGGKTKSLGLVNILMLHINNFRIEVVEKIDNYVSPGVHSGGGRI